MALSERVRRQGWITAWTEPKAYDAGEFNGQPFPAGRSMQLHITTEPHDHDRIKVKNAEVEQTIAAIEAVGLFGAVEVEVSIYNGTPTLHSIRPLAAARQG